MKILLLCLILLTIKFQLSICGNNGGGNDGGGTAVNGGTSKCYAGYKICYDSGCSASGIYIILVNRNLANSMYCIFFLF